MATKNRFDPRNWVEVVSNLITERTSPGDSIKLLIHYNGTIKPNVWLEFSTYDSEKKRYEPKEEITDWVDDKPYYEIKDDSTGRPIEGEVRRGSSDWVEYMEGISGVGPEIQKMIKTGGRNFSYEVIK